MLIDNRQYLMDEIRYKYSGEYILKTFLPGEIIVQEGSLCRELSIIVSGEALVIPSSVDGSNALIDILSKFDFIGDFELFKNEEYYHTVEAKYLTTVITFHKDKIKNLLEYREITNLLLLNLAYKLEKSSLKTKYNNTLEAPDRLLEYMKSRSHKDIYTRRNTFKEIAKSINVTDRHLRRIMNRLLQDNIVERLNENQYRVNKL